MWKTWSSKSISKLKQELNISYNLIHYTLYGSEQIREVSSPHIPPPAYTLHCQHETQTPNCVLSRAFNNYILKFFLKIVWKKAWKVWNPLKWVIQEWKYNLLNWSYTKGGKRGSFNCFTLLQTQIIQRILIAVIIYNDTKWRGPLWHKLLSRSPPPPQLQRYIENK